MDEEHIKLWDEAQKAARLISEMIWPYLSSINLSQRSSVERQICDAVGQRYGPEAARHFSDVLSGKGRSPLFHAGGFYDVSRMAYYIWTNLVPDPRPEEKVAEEWPGNLQDPAFRLFLTPGFLGWLQTAVNRVRVANALVEARELIDEAYKPGFLTIHLDDASTINAWAKGLGVSRLRGHALEKGQSSLFVDAGFVNAYDVDALGGRVELKGPVGYVGVVISALDHTESVEVLSTRDGWLARESREGRSPTSAYFDELDDALDHVRAKAAQIVMRNGRQKVASALGLD